ncbi:MAG: hypothetical protein PWQ10_364 [Patescibacteria group bacterium]|nr:hypothetical protein [Patescibacteria group bacterium]
MDIQPQTTQSISDDQELAKALAGVSKDTNNNLDFEETPAPTTITPPVEPVAETAQTPVNYMASNNKPTSQNNDIEAIKKDALIELRPLVDKLNLTPEEKFDIYLLLIRSTDDMTLIAPAHEAAKNIVDEAKRAQALLDVIKEIDFLSAPSQAAA